MKKPRATDGLHPRFLVESQRGPAAAPRSFQGPAWIGLSPDGTVEGWSTDAESLFGWEAADVLGKSWVNLLVEAESRAVVRRLLRDEQAYARYASSPAGFETTVIRRDGSSFQAELSFSSCQWGDETSFGLLVRDLSRGWLQGGLEKVLFEAAGEGIVIVDVSSMRILDANSKACGIHGYLPGELVGLHVRDLLPAPPDLSVVSRIQKALAETGSYESDAELHRRKDGSLFPCGINLRHVVVAGRSIKVAIYRDVSQQHQVAEELRAVHSELERTVLDHTEALVRTSQELAEEIGVRKTSEEALRKSDSWLKMLLTQLPAVLWTTDLDLRFTSMTGGGLNTLTIRPEHVLGRTMGEVMGAGEMGERAVHHHRQAVQGFSSSYVLLVKDRFFHSHVEPLRDFEGKTIGVIGVSLDDTPRLQAEKAARESEDRYRAIFERAPIGVGIAQEGILRYVNPTWLNMFGYSSPQEVLGRRIEDHLSPESRRKVADRAGRRANGENVPSGVDLVAIRKDGSTFDYHVETCHLDTAEGKSLVALGTDVTKRRQAEEASREAHGNLERKVAQRTRDLARAAEETRIAYESLKAAQDQLIRSEKLASIGMLVSGVAHEINNPLSVITGNLKLLTENDRLSRICGGKKWASPSEPKRVRHMLRDATKAARRACAIIETFRSFARDTRWAERVDLNECLRETVKIVERQLPSGIRLETRLGRIPKVHCFRGQMNQVFLNLIQNAVEAIDGRGTVQVRSSKAGNCAAIDVTDTGRGMSPEVQGRIFDPFFTTKPIGKGLGLGLSISGMIVENHSGVISLKSKVGKGTTFRVTLPIFAEGKAQSRSTE